MSRRLLSHDELRSAKGIRYSKSQINRLIREGKFPKPLAGAGRANAWLESEIDRYIDDLVAERDAAAA